ncbi:MAG: carboxypeptidase-like regulatory domain-containing protein, partial [Bacteroidales bacterium]|nr:carboxypeptidase-like regulatory domain-containing protein [Bacteroidales bacterium]
MEAIGLYLLRSAVWITGFALVYHLFLRNERFFLLNRIYLVTGILASVILPLVTIRYVVEVPVMNADVTAGALTGVVQDNDSWQHIMGMALCAAWLTGIVIIVLRYALQIIPVLRAAVRAGKASGYPVKVLRTSEFSGSFSLFSIVVVNPSVSETETREIMNHEMVHIKQMHSFDLLLASLLCAVHWFNPVTWMYARFIRQNHEYLADEEALQRTSHPAVYRAVLLNQIAGSPVIDLGNFFSQSLNKKRFQMMKNTISSPFRKLRMLLILPVAALVLFAFAEPQYRVSADSQSHGSSFIAAADFPRNVSGVVTDEKGNPLEGAVVIIKGTTIGTTTDAAGRFAIEDVPDDATLVVSYVGYVTKAILASAAGSNITIELQWGNVITDTVNIPPPPPPPPAGSIPSNALVVLDGEITSRPLSEIPPEGIK